MEKMDKFDVGAGEKKFLSDTHGVTAVEYGLITGLIAVGIIVALTSMGGILANVFNTLGNTLSNA